MERLKGAGLYIAGLLGWILKLPWFILKCLAQIVREEWKSQPWAVAAFCVPFAMLLSSWYGPVRGWTVLRIYLTCFVAILVVRILFWFRYRREEQSNEGRGWDYEIYNLYICKVNLCKNIAVALFCGGGVACTLLCALYLRSPEAKEINAKAEAHTRALITSGTLLDDEGRRGRVQPIAGVLTHNPQYRGEGRLMVVRVKIEREIWPVIAFLDPTACKDAILPGMGDKVELRPQGFRATSQGMYAKPGGDVLMWLYFVEPVCK